MWIFTFTFHFQLLDLGAELFNLFLFWCQLSISTKAYRWIPLASQFLSLNLYTVGVNCMNVKIAAWS